jgi:hypothetical protein
VPFRYTAGEVSGMAGEASGNNWKESKKTERFERVPNSIAPRERFIEDGLDYR